MAWCWVWIDESVDRRVSNRAVVTRRAPVGLIDPDDFAVVDRPMPEPGPGQVLFRGRYLCIDPSARRRMPAPDGVPGPLGATAAVGDPVLAGVAPARAGLDGALVGHVVRSRHPRFAPGDLVRGGNAWQLFHVADGEVLDKLEPAPGISLTDELGLLGRPGLVAHCGIELAVVQPGETVVISAAGGAIGMIAGQLAAIAGARVIGIASGDKTTFVVDELGFSGCVDRRAGDVTDQLDRLAPDGVDVYFDNVGGALQNDIFGRLNDFGRLIVCGMAAEYNDAEPAAGPPLRPVLRKRLRIQGFVVTDHYPRYPAYREMAVEAIRSGRLRYREHLIDGLHNAPQALADLLAGRTAGRVLIDCDPEGEAPSPTPREPENQP